MISDAKALLSTTTTTTTTLPPKTFLSLETFPEHNWNRIKVVDMKESFVQGDKTIYTTTILIPRIILGRS